MYSGDQAISVTTYTATDTLQNITIQRCIIDSNYSGPFFALDPNYGGYVQNIKFLNNHIGLTARPPDIVGHSATDGGGVGLYFGGQCLDVKIKDNYIDNYGQFAMSITTSLSLTYKGITSK